MTNKKVLSPSQEDYLEAIFHIVTEKQAARAKDIALRLQVNNSSVTGALRILTDKGFINYAPYDLITLTHKGIKLAEAIIRRHEALKDFFVKILLIDEEEAEKASCKMEHVISNKILDRLISFVEFVEICPRGGQEWLKGFRRYCEDGDTSLRCAKSISSCLEDLKKREQNFKNPRAETICLSDMNPGQRGKIVKIKARGELHRRLSVIGASCGNMIELEGIEAQDDRIDVKVRGYHLSFRSDEAAKISVELHE